MIDGGRVVSLFTTARYFLHDPFNNYYLLANLRQRFSNIAIILVNY